jgi:hypothetical protein
MSSYASFAANRAQSQETMRAKLHASPSWAGSSSALLFSPWGLVFLIAYLLNDFIR